MTNPASHTTASTEPASSKEQLAAEERRTGNLLADGAHRWILLACAAVYLVALFLPFAGGAAGWQVLAASDAAQQAQVTIAERVFTWCSLIGLGVLTPVAMLARRYGLAAIGWVVTAIALVNTLMAVWLRRSSANLTDVHGPGFYLAVFAVLVAVFAYIPAILRRSSEQQAVSVERAAAQGDDELAALQRSASTHHENPLLIDDRRARAAERHHRTGDGTSDR